MDSFVSSYGPAAVFFSCPVEMRYPLPLKLEFLRLKTECDKFPWEMTYQTLHLMYHA